MQIFHPLKEKSYKKVVGGDAGEKDTAKLESPALLSNKYRIYHVEPGLLLQYFWITFIIKEINMKQIGRKLFFSLPKCMNVYPEYINATEINHVYFLTLLNQQISKQANKILSRLPKTLQKLLSFLFR